MSYAEWWWSQTGGDGPDPDPGDPIGQSLRFRGAQNLIGPNLTQTLGTNTMSMWVKRGELANNLGLYGTSFRGYGVYFNGSDVLTPNTNTLVASSSVYRDTSAWCHFVFNADGAFCNGERVPAFTYDNNLYIADASDAMVVGAIHTSTYYFNGYIAEVHFIDGSSLEPTTFGRYNSEGVWVPVDPKKDGDTAWYGANGFHLTFADPGDVGKDYSGNGNDFTANGFDTASSDPTYDIMQDSPTNNFATINPLFLNGSTKDANLTAAGHTPCWARPQTVGFSAEGSHMFEWQTGASTAYDLVVISADPNSVNNFNGNSIYIQGGQNTSSPNQYGSYSQVTITGSGTTFQPNKYYQVSWDGTSMRLYQEGVLVTTYTNFPDIPQFLGIGNNYNDQYLNYGQKAFSFPIAGFKPLSTANMPAPTIINGRDHFQAITGPGQGNITSTVTNVQEINQVETHLTANATLTPQNNTDLLGVRVYMSGGSGAGGSAAYLDGLGGGPTAIGSNGNDTEWRTRFLTRTELNGSGAFTAGAGGTINSSGAGNYGGGAGQLSQFVTNGGGITLTAAGSNGGAGRYVPAGTNAVYTSAGGIASAGNMTVVDTTYTAIDGGKGAPGRNMPGTTNGSPGNTGQMYSLELYPTTSGIGVPSAVVILTLDNTTGLANINVGNTVENLNGTAEGTVVFIDGSTIYIEQTTGQFAINDRLVTSGAGNGLLGLAQETFPSGLWWIKDRANANQHQLVDSVRGPAKAITSPASKGAINYLPPSGDSVAWCWNYNSADPSINGFDIVEYTGTGVAQSINHGLGKAPELMIVQNLCNTCNAGGGFWAGVYHEALGPTKALILNTNSAQNTSATWWNNTAPTATQFTVGTQGNVNANGQDIIAYLWTSVPGYSAFGSYTGNYNSDGPFIYTGFKPAFVLTKAVGTGNWVLNDATRNPYNPVDNILYANGTQKDLTPYYDVDFLSNGFKIRSANTYNNPSSAAVVYAAFAENPFQSPVTAR